MPTRFQERLDQLHAIFIAPGVKDIERHGLPRLVQRRSERTYTVQVAVHADPCHPAKCIRGQKQDEHAKRTAMPGHDGPRLRSAKDDALVYRLLARPNR
jgi:hypothetical protein